MPLPAAYRWRSVFLYRQLKFPTYLFVDRVHGFFKVHFYSFGFEVGDLFFTAQFQVTDGGNDFTPGIIIWNTISKRCITGAGAAVRYRVGTYFFHIFCDG